MRQFILDKLKNITEEERNILDKHSGVDKTIYKNDSKREFVIDSKKMLSKEKLIDIRRHTRFVEFPKHKHDFIEIIYVCKGSVTNIINMTDTVILKEGELLFLNQYTSHSLLPTGENDIVVNFVVLPQFFDDAFLALDKESLLGEFLSSTLCSNSNAGKYLHFKCSNIVTVQNNIENMIWTLCQKQKGQEKINRLTMTVLLLQLMNFTEAIAGNDSELFDKKIILNVLQYIETHYKNASLTEIASELSMKSYKLCKLIKKATDKTFAELLLQKRLTLAANLLNSTALSITDIIIAVGYDNTSYFHRVFKEKYAMTPKLFRQKNSQIYSQITS